MTAMFESCRSRKLTRATLEALPALPSESSWTIEVPLVEARRERSTPSLESFDWRSFFCCDVAVAYAILITWCPVTSEAIGMK